jgi:hypothetical protein
MNSDVVGSRCSVHRESEKYLNNFSWDRYQKGKDHFEDLSVDGTIFLKGS